MFELPCCSTDRSQSLTSLVHHLTTTGQVQECKVVLNMEQKEQSIRQLWVKKKEIELILGMLDKLEMLKETPAGMKFPLGDPGAR
jgi:hypothetical protein